jgi:hypothetical protein
MLADSLGVCICEAEEDGEKMLGFDLAAEDGNVFGHCHMALEEAESLLADLTVAVRDLRRERGIN